MRETASFRDPSGFLFTRHGVLYRQVNQYYKADYDLLMSSGLYASLVKGKLLVPHAEVDVPPAVKEVAYKVIQPERVDFISYPYEWSFSQLKDAALATLTLVRKALKKGMVLKDASAYNIQFHQGRPVLIDTLSFEAYCEGEPWVAYRQFCQHFLAPLALMAKRDIRLNQLMRIYIDGIPLDLASSLLPGGTRWNLGLAAHIHLHAGAQKRYSGKEVRKEAVKQGVSRMAFEGLINSLEAVVNGLTWTPGGTEWGAYYDATNYSTDAFEAKKQVVREMILAASPKSVWDLGGNTGVFSRLASEQGIFTVSWDIDPTAVEANYRQMRTTKETQLLPLVLDLTNPSPSLGWANAERKSLAERGPVDLVMALALIHHLAISNNVPFAMLAEMFAGLGKWLLIEFVPKEDSQVQRLLTSRVDIFTEYTQKDFERVFGELYHIRQKQAVEGSARTLYLMERK